MVVVDVKVSEVEVEQRAGLCSLILNQKCCVVNMYVGYDKNVINVEINQH